MEITDKKEQPAPDQLTEKALRAIPSAIEIPKHIAEEIEEKPNMSREQKRIVAARKKQYEFETEAFDNRLVALMDRFLEEWDGSVIGYGLETIIRYDDLWKMTADNHNNHKKIVCRVERKAFRMYLERPEEVLTVAQLYEKHGNAGNVYNPKIKTVIFNAAEMSWSEFIPVIDGLMNRPAGEAPDALQFNVSYNDKTRILIVNDFTPPEK